MTAFEYLRSAIGILPILAKFAILMVLIVLVPGLSRRVGLPEGVGLEIDLKLFRQKKFVVFVPLVLFGLSRAGAYVLGKVENEEETYFVLMLGILAVTALLAQLINLPGIVGTFLAGLAVNAVVKDKPAKSKLEFIGTSLFIPIFFVVTGFLIDPLTLVRGLIDDFSFAAGIIGALVAGKWMAAEMAGRAFGYAPAARRTMWSLTLPQLAATLAATLVAYKTVNATGQPLLDGKMLNVVLVMVVATSVLGPVPTQRFAPELRQPIPDRAGPGTVPD